MGGGMVRIREGLLYGAFIKTDIEVPEGLMRMLGEYF
jgi:hypothetical protein